MRSRSLLLSSTPPCLTPLHGTEPRRKWRAAATSPKPSGDGCAAAVPPLGDRTAFPPLPRAGRGSPVPGGRTVLVPAKAPKKRSTTATVSEPTFRCSPAQARVAELLQEPQLLTFSWAEEVFQSIAGAVERLHARGAAHPSVATQTTPAPKPKVEKLTQTPPAGPGGADPLVAATTRRDSKSRVPSGSGAPPAVRARPPPSEGFLAESPSTDIRPQGVLHRPARPGDNPVPPKSAAKGDKNAALPVDPRKPPGAPPVQPRRPVLLPMPELPPMPPTTGVEKPSLRRSPPPRVPPRKRKLPPKAGDGVVAPRVPPPSAVPASTPRVEEPANSSGPPGKMKVADRPAKPESDPCTSSGPPQKNPTGKPKPAPAKAPEKVPPAVPTKAPKPAKKKAAGKGSGPPLVGEKTEPAGHHPSPLLREPPKPAERRECGNEPAGTAEVTPESSTAPPPRATGTGPRSSKPAVGKPRSGPSGSQPRPRTPPPMDVGDTPPSTGKRRKKNRRRGKKRPRKEGGSAGPDREHRASGSGSHSSSDHGRRRKKSPFRGRGGHLQRELDAQGATWAQFQQGLVVLPDSTSAPRQPAWRPDEQLYQLRPIRPPPGIPQPGARQDWGAVQEPLAAYQPQTWGPPGLPPTAAQTPLSEERLVAIVNSLIERAFESRRGHQRVGACGQRVTTTTPTPLGQLKRRF